MIESKINGASVMIPTSWRDVPFKNYLAYLDAETNIDKAAALTGISKDTLTQLEPSGFGTLFMVLSFMNDAPPAYYDNTDGFDIAKESYGKIETAKALIAAAKKPHHAIIEVVKIYTGKDISDAPTSEANPIAAFFLLSCMTS